MKTCIKCHDEKPKGDFYSGQGDCKECTKKRVKARENRLREIDSEWVEKEKERHRDKYLRLDYKTKQKEWDAERPWKNYSEYKNLARDLSLPKGFEAHHWSYKKGNIRSVFVLPINSHKQAHRFLEFDKERRCFIFNGRLLDTKMKHEVFLKSKNLIQ